jgi:hypothetical protein
MRKQLVHKPAPVLKAAPLPPAKSGKPLTEPKSPAFATRSRVRLQGEENVA